MIKGLIILALLGICPASQEARRPAEPVAVTIMYWSSTITGSYWTMRCQYRINDGPLQWYSIASGAPVHEMQLPDTSIILTENVISYSMNWPWTASHGPDVIGVVWDYEKPKGL